jgi:hypothetical protein
LLTFPDLSKLSPFGNNGGPDGDDNCDIYHETVKLSFPKELLLGIVSNVNEYESFVPYCVESNVNESSRRQIDVEKEEFSADLAIGYGQLRESYTSRVTIVRGKSVQVNVRKAHSDFACNLTDLYQTPLYMCPSGDSDPYATLQTTRDYLDLRLGIRT